MTKKRNRRRAPWREKSLKEIEELKIERDKAFKANDRTWAEICSAKISMIEHMLIHDD